MRRAFVTLLLVGLFAVGAAVAPRMWAEERSTPPMHPVVPAAIETPVSVIPELENPVAPPSVAIEVVAPPPDFEWDGCPACGMG